ncbi:MAG: hypothetical protein COS92_08370 [Desulfobacterales bacterium CG07_land_8_20_14_0_80_52_14]|nr:MAG: hypothetical protein COS92_08370 [Desulfobacterales bacterium CG07_land_8_20_14_0_80_52_14]
MKMLRGLLIFLLMASGIHAGASEALSQESFRVRWVDDGDTVMLENGRHVRYIGIDAPEVQKGDQKGEPLGKEAAAFNRNLVSGKRVRLVFDREVSDRYGRWLAYVYLPDETLVNAALIKAGFAHLLCQTPNLGRIGLLLAAQRRAMTAKRGIWGNLQEKAKIYIGNRFSKRFHLPDCPRAKEIHPKNRVIFTRIWDPFWEGYAPASCCMSP